MTALRFWITIASCFLLRSGRSTAALSVMVLSAVTVLIFLSALAVGVNDAMVRNSATLFSGHITGSNLPFTVSPADLKVDGVHAVLPRLITSGILVHQQHIVTVNLIGVDIEQEQQTTALWKKKTAGQIPRPTEKALFLSTESSRALGVKPGDTVLFSKDLAGAGALFTIAGTYETGVDQLDQGIAFCPRAAFPTAVTTWSAALFLQDGKDPEAIVPRIQQRAGPGPSFQTWSDLMPDLRQLIELNHISMIIVIVIVFSVVALGISCAFVIFIVRNLREYGIMKAMGITAGETLLLIGSEVMLMSLAASAIGIALGTMLTLLVARSGIDLTAFTSYNRYFAVSGMIYPRLTAFSIWTPPALALAASLGAALWPTMLVIHKKAADILRSV